MVNSLKDSVEEQKSIVKDVVSDRKKEKRNSELSRKSRTKLENELSAAIQTTIPSSSKVNNVLTIDEGLVDQLIEKLTNKLSVPLITKDKTVRTIDEVTQETLPK